MVIGSHTLLRCCLLFIIFVYCCRLFKQPHISDIYIVVANDWWMGGWKQRTCSTGILSESLVFKYLFKTAKIWLFRIWNFLIRSTIFFNCCKVGKKWLTQIRLKHIKFCKVIAITCTPVWFSKVLDKWIRNLQCLWHFRPSYPLGWPWGRGNRNPAPQTSVAVTTRRWGHIPPNSVPPHTIPCKNSNHMKTCSNF